jgi:outer membrane protein OmpA-like peptidoglycan-associated protein
VRNSWWRTRTAVIEPDIVKFAGGIRSTEVSTVQNDEAFLSQHPSIKVLIEGRSDDRGSEEYNRAESVKRAPVQAGISSESHPNRQLRKKEAVLHPAQRTVLAAEPG